LGCSKQQHTTAIASLVLTFILSIGDLQQARSHAQNPLLLHLIGVSIGVPAGVRPFPLLGQRSDEFAAEVGDVGDHAAPDRVGSSRRTLEGVSGGPLVQRRKRRSALAGLVAGVACETR
jgi:hypothetical protein